VHIGWSEPKVHDWTYSCTYPLQRNSQCLLECARSLRYCEFKANPFCLFASIGYHLRAKSAGAHFQHSKNSVQKRVRFIGHHKLVDKLFQVPWGKSVLNMLVGHAMAPVT